MLKRKNEDGDTSTDDNLSKRVALDSEQLESTIRQQEEANTAPVINNGPEEYDPATIQTEDKEAQQSDPSDKEDEAESNEEKSEQKPPEGEEDDKESDKEAPKDKEEQNPQAPESDDDEFQPNYSHSDDESKEKIEVTIDTGSNEDGHDVDSSANNVSHQRERDDPTTVSFRMYCPVREAGSIVGKRGDKIKHIREKANVRINVSENLKEVPERIVLVRGSSENVAKAFGLIARAILDEPEDEPSTMQSRLYDLRLLIPHPMVGFIIGKQGSKFREIEENSAAKLKAAETPLPYSTDRILSINGVSDAIHIAVYYVAQVWLDHKDILHSQKTILYNPANYQPNGNPASTLTGMNAGNNNHNNRDNGNSNMSNMNNMNNMGNVNNMGTMNALNALNSLSNMMVPPANNNMMMMGNNPMAANTPIANNPMASPMAGNAMTNSPMNNPMNVQNPHSPYGQHKQPYNFQMMFQPSVNPQQNYNNSRQSMNVPPQQSYTDEHGNLMVGEVLTHPPVSLGSGDKYNQDLFVANHSIGSVIGKGGNNIKQIRETSGCAYVKIEHDRGQTMLLGGGKGLVNMRKLTLTGSLSAINTAIYLINQRINVDKERNFN